MSSNLIIRSRLLEGIEFMKLTILRIENEIVNCQLDNGSIIDIARRWFTGNIKEGDMVEFDVNDSKSDK